MEALNVTTAGRRSLPAPRRWVPRPRAGIAGQIRIVDPVETEPSDGWVCYFGEAVDIYEGGEIVGHEGLGAPTGSGAPGVAPGIFMPATPEPGMSFQQEVTPGVAEDQATIAGNGTVTLPDGTVAETITVRDFNPLSGSGAPRSTPETLASSKTAQAQPDQGDGGTGRWLAAARGEVAQSGAWLDT